MIPLVLFLAVIGMVYAAVVETAFGVLMRLPHRLEAEHDEDHRLRAFLDDPIKLFVPARIIRGGLLVGAIVLLAQEFGTGLEAGIFLFITGLALNVIFGQLLPAWFVRRAPERALELLLPGFTVVANVVAPLTSLIVSWLGAPAEPRRLLKSVIDFGETQVREVMTPRPDIVAIRADATLEELRRLVQEQEYSRLPVYTDNIDNIAGFIVVKDLFQLPEQPSADRHVKDFMRAAAFVPETNRVADVLREFQQKRVQAAIVVDEYGGTAGLVTVEDVVEELVGEIRDEYDVEVEPIVSEPDGAFVFSAKVAIDDMTERLGVAIESDGFETVGGFVLSRVGRVPTVGEKFTTDGLDVEVLEAERRRIHRVRVKPASDSRSGGPLGPPEDRS
ncbi:MAG: hemolysin family protein [Acidobacteriota bacterium]